MKKCAVPLRLAAALFLSVWLDRPARALPDPTADGLRRCAAETDRDRRLACFDALVTALPRLQADQVGLTRDITQRRDPTPAPPPAVGLIEGRITALRRGSGGELTFILDNQQVWKQTEFNPRLEFAVGDGVRIEGGSMGSLWLSADRGRKTRVKRIS